MTTNAGASSARRRWSMTGDGLSGLRAETQELAGDTERTRGSVTAHERGEPDAPTLVPNIGGQRWLQQLDSVQDEADDYVTEWDPRLT